METRDALRRAALVAVFVAASVSCADGQPASPPDGAGVDDAEGDANSDYVDYAPARIEEIASNETQVCARLSDERVFCWGDLGANECVKDASLQTSPTLVPMLSHVGISKLSLHGPNCALHADRTVSCWGSFPAALMGRNTTEAATCFERAPTSISDVDELETGFMHACVRRHGEIWCWGKNESFQSVPAWDQGTGDVAAPTKIVGIASAMQIVASQPSCAASEDGAVWCWGSDPWRPDDATRPTSPALVAGLSDVKSIDGTYTTGIAQTASGSIFEFRASMRGVVASPTALDVLAGSIVLHSVPWQTWHRLSGKMPSIGGGSNIVVGLDPGGAAKVYTPQTPQFEIAKALADVRNVRLLALAQTSVCVVLGDTEIRCAGWNDFGQLGDGTKADSLTRLKTVRWPKSVR